MYHAFTLFGRPKSITAFYRVQRDAPSENEDSFTIILQYDGPQEDLLVTVKTAVTTPMDKQLKYWVRGTKGAYIKWQQTSLCPQESAIAEGKTTDDPSFGTEPDHLRGTLTTYEEFDGGYQTWDERVNKFTGAVPTKPGRWSDLYKNVAGAILGKEELAVKAGDVRDCLRILELAKESSDKGVTVAWR
jgi:predicted dehydrogenase